MGGKLREKEKAVRQQVGLASERAGGKNTETENSPEGKGRVGLAPDRNTSAVFQ